jgi:hypothetical protein
LIASAFSKALFHHTPLSFPKILIKALHSIMGTQGVVYRDLIDEAVPESHPAAHASKTSTLHGDTTTTLLDAPTESHALALEAAKATHPAEAGAAQVQHAEEVVDLGWNEPKEHIAAPLVGGLSNEDLWLLVRRFNKVRMALRAVDQTQLNMHSKCTMSRRS